MADPEKAPTPPSVNCGNYGLWLEMRNADKLAEKRAKDPGFDWLVSVSDAVFWLFVLLGAGSFVAGWVVGIAWLIASYW